MFISLFLIDFSQILCKALGKLNERCRVDWRIRKHESCAEKSVKICVHINVDHHNEVNFLLDT